MYRLIPLFLLALFSSAFAEEPSVTVMDNGLTVITQELHYAPVIASVISYRVGARNETGDILGMSHFCEHQMFKGTLDMPKGRFWQIVQRDGGSANAFTSEDVTCYYLILPSSRIEDALAIESDRMTNCTIDSAEVVSEANVVHEERRMRTTDSPNGALWEALAETAYTEHPYGLPVIGYDENILAYDHIKTRAYYETYYVPSNAVLTIVGDFETEELLAQIEEYFGDIPAGNLPEETIPVEPRQNEARFVEIEHNSNLPRFIMAFHSNDGNNPATPAMAMISSYLSGGRSARLDQILVETNMVYEIGAYDQGGIDPGLFTISVSMNPPSDGESEVTMEEVQEIIWNELDDLAENGIPASTLEQLKNRYRAREILGDANPVGLAMGYSLSTTMYGDPMYSQKQLELVEELTPEAISRAAADCFRRDGVTIGVLTPVGGNGRGTAGGNELPTDVTEPSSIDYTGLEIPEDFLTPPTSSIADGVERFELDNGLVLLVKEDHAFPVASINFSLPMGSLMHPSALAGLASTTAETMMNGTEELGYIDFHKRLETEGSSLRFGAGIERASGSITLLSEDLETGFTTIEDLLLHPAFREVDYEKVMFENYTSLEESAEQAFSVAYDSLTAIIADSPDDYRRMSEASLDRISLEEVTDFYSLCCRPEGTVITVVGDIAPETALALVENHFSDWNNPTEALPTLKIPQFTTAHGDTVVTFMDGRMQGTVLVAAKAPGFAMPDFAAFNVMNTILGRGIGSRLGHSVRDEQGLAYGVGSWASQMDSSGVFTAYLSTLADYVPQATVSVTNEMERIAVENVQDIELRLAKANSVGRQAMSGMSYSGLAAGLTTLESTGRPLDWNNAYLSRVLELTPDELREAAATYFIPGEWFVSIAGNVTEEDLVEE